MEYIVGCFFNLIWVAVSFAFGCFVYWLFGFVNLPAYLELGTTIALSFWPGFFVMGMIARGGTKSATPFTFLEELKFYLGLEAITAATCAIAILTHFAAQRIPIDSYYKQFIVMGVAYLFFHIAMDRSIKRMERRNLEERDSRKELDKHNPL